jgi:hypothetical protein
MKIAIQKGKLKANPMTMKQETFSEKVTEAKNMAAKRKGMQHMKPAKPKK